MSAVYRELGAHSIYYFYIWINLRSISKHYLKIAFFVKNILTQSITLIYTS